MHDDIQSDLVRRVKDDHKQIMEQLSDPNLFSLRISADDIFKKAILLCAASYYETRVSTILTDLYKNNFGDDHVLTEFVKNQAVERQYFKMFRWDKNNLNGFFRLFGSDFKEYMQEEVQKDAALDKSIKAFLKLGLLRDKATHGNLVEYNLEMTADEVFSLYEQSAFFVDNFPEYIESYARGPGFRASEAV